MAHRSHLFTLRIFHALTESLTESPYSLKLFSQDLLAGITVGIIAIPLAMALAIASGVSPEYGLYTAIIAGFIIPLTGGSRYSVSGPTAAFVVILYPIVQQYGLSGLLLATILAGIILILMAFLRLGRYIEYIPESVTLGFTGGIAVVIATLQIKDFLGLQIANMPEHFIDKAALLFHLIPDYNLYSLSVGAITLLVMLSWPYLKTPIPAHLPAVIIGSFIALIANQSTGEVATIGSSFNFVLPNGAQGFGIPSILPELLWPWHRTQAGEPLLVFSWQLLQDLLPAAFAIAMLGAIESLLCAVVLDGMSGKKHSANSELLGQGIGNIITPFFGGITATAAIARSAANFKSGAKTPIASIIHALVVLVALIFLSKLLSYLPMASMAALLLIVAWNMSEAPKALHLLKTAPLSDLLVLLLCFSLTVLFDMVIAISAGIIFASLLFMKQIAETTTVREITHTSKLIDVDIPDGYSVFKICGPLFFAASDKIFGELSLLCASNKGVILYLDAVSIVDSGGVTALRKFIEKSANNNTKIYLADLQRQPLKTLSRANLTPNKHVIIVTTLALALQNLKKEEEFH
ncbi:C4-dicarboxylic acid transporter DauA [Gammaproteobacteria bacterium AS21]